MDSLEQDYGTALFEGATPPCISLYQPTHRNHPDNAQDPIQFRNLVGSLEESLRRQYDKTDVEALLQPFSSLARNAEFWNHALDGLAVLEHHSRPSDLPLLLVGVAENQSVFRKVSRNQLLVEEGIDIGPKAWSIDAVRERAWRILEPRYVERLRGFVDQFNEAHGKGLASDDLDQVVSARERLQPCIGTR